jgi:hypothetical protein
VHFVGLVAKFKPYLGGREGSRNIPSRETNPTDKNNIPFPPTNKAYRTT